MCITCWIVAMLSSKNFNFKMLERLELHYLLPRTMCSPTAVVSSPSCQHQLIFHSISSDIPTLELTGNIFLHFFFSMLEHILELHESIMTFNVGVGKLQVNQVMNSVLCVRWKKGCQELSLNATDESGRNRSQHQHTKKSGALSGCLRVR